MSKIPHCCLPQESGPCLSASVAARPLRPATDRRLGGPLPRQPANRPRTPPRAHMLSRQPSRPPAYAVLAPVSRGYPPLRGQVIHVLLTRSPLYSDPEGPFRVRLACVRRAASVDSEPGSNSRLKGVRPPGQRAQRRPAPAGAIPPSLPIRLPPGIRRSRTARPTDLSAIRAAPDRPRQGAPERAPAGPRGGPASRPPRGARKTAAQQGAYAPS